MPAIINTNIASLNAQRNLSTSQSSLSTALQRLSSGLRINSAKDDAAGLAISDRFTTQIRGLNQAARNASDGISLSQTGESALGERTNNLQRIRELAVQAANSTNSSSDRSALDLEVQQRLAEIDRIATQTSFNGQKVLDGTFGGATFQVGANVGETISLDLGTSMRRNAIGAVATATTADLRTLAIAAADAVPTTTSASGTFTQAVLANAETFTMTVGGVQIYTRTAAGAENITAAILDGDTLGSGTGGLGNATVVSNLAAAGITFTGTAAGGDLVFTDAQGDDITVAVTNGGSGGTFGTAGFVGAHTNGTAAVTADPLTIADLTITVGENDAVTVADGDYATPQAFIDAVNTALAGSATVTYNSTTGVMSIISREAVEIGGTDAATVFTATDYALAGSLSAVNVETVAGANDTISRIDAALTEVSTLRSTFGAIQNRFESTISNLQAVSENLEASRSRILDADFAAETAALTRAQILQQAGIAILAQANAVPQNVLGLLQ